MHGTALSLFALTRRPDCSEVVVGLATECWPEYLLNANTSGWSYLSDCFRDYQILLCSGRDQVIGVGHTVLLAWDGDVSNLPIPSMRL